MTEVAAPTVDVSASTVDAATTTATASTPDVPATTITVPTTSGEPGTSGASSSSSGIDEVLAGILQAHLDAREFIGARLAVMSSDGSITESSAGSATIDGDGAGVDADVPWGIGSITKSFIAVVVLQLAEEGRIDLDAPIIDVFPDLPGADRITPRQLLQHTSGLGEYLDDPLVLDDAHREWTPAELIAVAEAGGRFGSPGGASHYANTNFIVLGEIVEHTTGGTWDAEVHSRIVEPLGMTHTDVIGTDGAVGYTLVDGVFVDATQRWHPSVGGAAGGLESTNRDLLRFADALAAGALLSPESQTAMQTFVPGEDYSSFGIVHSYGLGLERYENDSITVYGHLGSGSAHSAFVGFDVDRGTAASVMMNSDNAGPQAVMTVEALIAIGTAG